jgi:hypothetical protein
MWKDYVWGISLFRDSQNMGSGNFKTSLLNEVSQQSVVSRKKGNAK